MEDFGRVPIRKAQAIGETTIERQETASSGLPVASDHVMRRRGFFKALAAGAAAAIVGKVAESPRTWRGYPVLSEDDLKTMDFPYPPEISWTTSNSIQIADCTWTTDTGQSITF